MRQYPRFGQTLAPEALSELLHDAIPEWAGKRDAFTRLRDLDASAWEYFSPEECRELAEEVVASVQRRLPTIAAPIADQALGPAIAGLTLSDLNLDTRTYNCLFRSGLLERVGWLSRTTIRELLLLPAFGAKSLVDLLSAYQSHRVVDEEIRREVSQAWARLAAVHGVPNVKPEDPRLGDFVRSIDENAEDLDDALGGAFEVEDRLATKDVLRILTILEDAVDSIHVLSLEEELMSLAAEGSQQRNAAIACKVLGWDGEGGSTLQSVGDEYGMSRERVRQITRRVEGRLSGTSPYAPALDLALRVIRTSVPEDSEDLADILRREGPADGNFQPWGIAEAARVLGRPFPYSIERVGNRQVVVPASHAALLPDVRHIARRTAGHYGAANVADVIARCSDDLAVDFDEKFIREILSGEPNVSWLDEEEEWFWFAEPNRNPLVSNIRKIASVAPRIAVSEMKSGISRHYRMKGFVPPRRVLLRLCSELPGFAIEGDTVVAHPPPDRRLVLGPNENAMVDVLMENGPLVPVYDLEQACVDRGINRSTFWVYLGNQPVFVRVAPGYYAIRGADIPPGTLETLQQSSRRPRPVLTDFGWTQDKKIWLTYRISRALLSSGVVTVPAAMNPYLNGSYGLYAEDESRAGKLTLGKGMAWGLVAFLRRWGADEGDTLLLVVDPPEHRVVAQLGDDSLIDRIAGAGNHEASTAGAATT